MPYAWRALPVAPAHAWGPSQCRCSVQDADPIALPRGSAAANGRNHTRDATHRPTTFVLPAPPTCRLPRRRLNASATPSERPRSGAPESTQTRLPIASPTWRHPDDYPDARENPLNVTHHLTPSSCLFTPEEKPTLGRQSSRRTISPKNPLVNPSSPISTTTVGTALFCRPTIDGRPMFTVPNYTTRAPRQSVQTQARERSPNHEPTPILWC